MTATIEQPENEFFKGVFNLKQKIQHRIQDVKTREAFMKHCIGKMEEAGFEVDVEQTRMKIIHDIVTIKQKMQLEDIKVVTSEEKNEMMEEIIIGAVKLHSTLYSKKYFKG